MEWARGRGDQVVAVAARLEAELADLEPDEAAEFRAELGADEAGTLDVVLRAAYEVLGYITFFTGDFRSSESRAWQLPRGWTAKQAAGRIHSDIEHGFVRAQVVNIDDLIELEVVPRRTREGAAAHRGQGVRRPGRRRDQLHAHGLSVVAVGGDAEGDGEAGCAAVAPRSRRRRRPRNGEDGLDRKRSDRSVVSERTLRRRVAAPSSVRGDVDTASRVRLRHLLFERRVEGT